MISAIRHVTTTATFQKGLGVCGAALVAGTGFKFALDTSKNIAEVSKMQEKHIEPLIVQITSEEEKKIEKDSSPVISKSHCPYGYTWSAVAAVTAVAVSAIIVGAYFLSAIAKR